MPEEKPQETREIKLKVLDMIKETIEAKLNTINKIDGKMGILVGFYFLAFIEIVWYIKDYKHYLFLLYIITFGVSTFFLVKNFWLKDIKHLHPDFGTYISHT